MEIFKNFILNIWKNEIFRQSFIVLVTAVVTYYFTVRKIKKEQRIKYETDLGNKITQAYLDVREFITESNTIELLDIDKCVKVKDIFVSQEYAVYPAFMKNKNSLHIFSEKLSLIRKKM